MTAAVDLEIQRLADMLERRDLEHQHQPSSTAKFIEALCRLRQIRSDHTNLGVIHGNR